MTSMLQKPPVICLMQIYSAGQNTSVRQITQCIGGHQHESDVAAEDNRVSACLVHILLDMCYYFPSAYPRLQIDSMMHDGHECQVLHNSQITFHYRRV